MWRLVHVALANIWLLVVLSASVHAQVLAPTTLALASHDQKASDDMGQVITAKAGPKSEDEPVKEADTKGTTVIATKTKQRPKEETAAAISKDPTRTFAI